MNLHLSDTQVRVKLSSKNRKKLNAFIRYCGRSVAFGIMTDEWAQQQIGVMKRDLLKSEPLAKVTP